MRKIEPKRYYIDCSRFLTAMPPGIFLLAFFVIVARIFLYFCSYDCLGLLDYAWRSWMPFLWFIHTYMCSYPLNCNRVSQDKWYQLFWWATFVFLTGAAAYLLLIFSKIFLNWSSFLAKKSITLCSDNSSSHAGYIYIWVFSYTPFILWCTRSTLNSSWRFLYDFPPSMGMWYSLIYCPSSIHIRSTIKSKWIFKS